MGTTPLTTQDAEALAAALTERMDGCIWNVRPGGRDGLVLSTWLATACVWLWLPPPALATTQGAVMYFGDIDASLAACSVEAAAREVIGWLRSSEEAYYVHGHKTLPVIDAMRRALRPPLPRP